MNATHLIVDQNFRHHRLAPCLPSTPSCLHRVAMRAPSFIFLLLLLQNLAMLAHAFSAEDMVKAAAATTLGERCASEHIHCLM